ncbi:MAG: ABC-three component system protein [Myxococcota bacterium]
MNINEVINITQQTFGRRLTRDDVRAAIEEGIKLPVSKVVVRLEAHCPAGEYEIDDEQLDRFFSRFEQEAPGRYIPVEVRRTLLIEAGYACGRCKREGPIEFHHIIEFHRIGHHDPEHMIALCPTCHTMCGNGTIDRKAQEEFKHRLQNPGAVAEAAEVVRFTWDDLREVVESIHATVVTNGNQGESAHDFSLIDLDAKDELNGMGSAYAELIRTAHLPFFADIKSFFGSPANRVVQEMYHEVVDDLRTQVAVNPYLREIPFENFLSIVREQVLAREPARMRGRTRALTLVLSFMYANCDIGRKTPST